MYTWRGFPIILTDHAYDKMSNIRLSMWDLIQILDYSEDCLEDKRRDVFERCTKWRKKEIKVVFKKEYSKWAESLGWIIITVMERR